jgi:beta-glucosidase
MQFQMPDKFIWGVSTSAYESEGALTLDGRGPVNWDGFALKPGVIKDGTTGVLASRSYEEWSTDVQWLKQLGVNAYRFSIAWSRILPDGRGAINQKGLDHYSRLVDALLANNIRPYIMLYHWDLPQALEARGGWQSRETAAAFAEYAAITVKHLGDRVKDWMTLEEIATGIGQGYSGKGLAPNLRLAGEPLAQVYHHALVAHGLGVQAIRAECRDARVGLVMDTVTAVPVIEDAAHLTAARAAYQWLNGYLTDPLFLGKYPAHLEAFPDVQAGDMELISQPLDFFGASIYAGIYFEPADNAPGFRRVEFPEQYPMVRDLDWMRFVPQALYWSVRHAYECYGHREIYVLESGYATDTTRDEDSQCNDIDRIMAMRCYLRELHRATAEGIPVRGHFNWSLVDDWEWHNGYTKSLGLVHYNRVTGARRAKRSFGWFQSVIRNNAVV